MPYELLWEPGGLYRRYHGDLRLSERRDSLQGIVTDARFDALRYAITDYTEVLGFEDRAAATEESAAMHVGPTMTNPRIHAAAVVPPARSDILASVLVFKALAPSALRYQVFATLVEARAWVSMAARQLRPGSGAARLWR